MIVNVYMHVHTMQFLTELVIQMLATALVVCLVHLLKQMLISWLMTQVVIYTG